MKSKLFILFLTFIILAGFAGCDLLSLEKKVVILSPPEASSREILAAREIRRYIYQCSGRMLKIINDELKIPKNCDLIIVAAKDREITRKYALDAGLNSLLDILMPEHYLLKTFNLGNKRILLVSGDETGTLYSAYRYAESLGVRFYLHGDVIPDSKIKYKLTNINQDAKPLFALRGILPYYDLSEGPDLSNVDDYKAVISQLPKLRMNFFGFYDSRDGGILSDRDDLTVDLFAHASELGIKTGLGTDMQFTESGSSREQYGDLFGRMGQTYDPDYFVLLTPDERGVTTNESGDEPVIIRAAAGAMEDTGASFKLAAGGTAFWQELNREVSRGIAAVSVVGSHSESSTDDALERIYNREKWMILLPEDGGSSTVPQYHADRIRTDVSNALNYKYTALIGLLPHEGISDPGMSVLAQAVLDTSITNEVLPDNSALSSELTADPGFIVPTVRTAIMADEPLRLKAIVSENVTVTSVELHWRTIGKGRFTAVPLTLIDRGVYSVELPAGTSEGNDIEYYIEAVADSGEELHFPATAPELNQTVVVLPGN